jgi:hypothetical protein
MSDYAVTARSIAKIMYATKIIARGFKNERDNMRRSLSTGHRLRVPTMKEMTEERAIRELICGLCDDCHKRLNICQCNEKGKK